jgi:hypothetical protein
MPGASWVKQEGMWTLPVRGTSGITVHHHVDHHPQEWLVTFHALGIEARPFKALDSEAAMVEAVELVLRSVRALGDAVLSATGKT